MNTTDAAAINTAAERTGLDTDTVAAAWAELADHYGNDRASALLTTHSADELLERAEARYPAGEGE